MAQEPVLAENLPTAEGDAPSTKPTPIRNSSDKPANGKSFHRWQVVKENRKLFDYYKAQGIVPDDEWDAFEAILKVDLPASFRVQLSLPEAALVDAHLQHYFKAIAESGDDQVAEAVPKPIAFVPYGYQTNMSRHVMRSSPLLKELHEFVVNETEIGVLSRQEAVSMIPPLLLDVQPHHMVLDACAAPGSKTSQLIELMHRDGPDPSGLLVANDLDYTRCYLLIHQALKRLPTGNCVIVNQDAAQFPTILGPERQPVFFDRVLCDVICSGDGTFRKNYELWRNWDPSKGLGLHRLQFLIAKRCLEVLKPGGRMVYSTCSLNPIEDESVLAALLRHYGTDKLRIVDVSAELPELKRAPGIDTWKVVDRDMNHYATPANVPDRLKQLIKPSMFPPTPEEAADFHLERSFRILPHAQNSGGFFVAVLEKLQAFDGDSRIVTPSLYAGPAKKRKRRMVREDPFTFLKDEDSVDIREDIEKHYGVSPDFPYNQLLVRTADTDKKKAVYFVNEKLREFMRYNEERFKVVNAGVGVLRRVDKVSISKYRVMQDGLALMSAHLNKRIITVSIPDAIRIIEGSKDNHYVGLDELDDASAFRSLESGSVVLRIGKDAFRKDICVWIGERTATAFITREEKIHCLIMLGHDPVKLRRQVVNARQAKAMNQSATALAENNSKVDSPAGDAADGAAPAEGGAAAAAPSDDV